MRCPVLPVKATKVFINQSYRAVTVSFQEMSWRHTNHVLPQETGREGSICFFCPLVQTGKVYSFFTHSWNPSTLRSQNNKVEVLAGEIIGATWSVIKSWCNAREMYTRDPSADRHKNTKSLYKATASSTRHFKAVRSHQPVIISSEQLTHQC